MKVLPILHKKKVAPVVVTVVDNFPKKFQTHTSTKDAFRYLRYIIYDQLRHLDLISLIIIYGPSIIDSPIFHFRKYGLKIALDEDLTSRIHGDSDLSLMNYEFIYMVII